VGIGALVGLAMSACGSGTSEAPDPWRAEVLNARSQATSDFERAVLSDGQISRAEYEESVHRYVSCMKSSAVDMLAQLQPSGFYAYRSTDYSDAANDTCAKGTTLLVEALYVARSRNPQRRDEDDLVADCLIRRGLAPKGFSAAELKKAQENHGQGLGFSAEDPRFAECRANPSAA
jgi:hypothetical protein